MLYRNRFALVIAGLIVAAALPAPAQFVTKPLSPDQKVSPSILINRINLRCATAKAQTKLDRPTRVVRTRSAAWRVASDADFTVAEQTRASTQLVEIWKRAGNLQFIRAHRFNARGVERATELCFRNDGTLARVRQATTIPALDEAAVRQAYINADGSLIQASAGFDTKDESISMRVRALPYYHLVQ